MNIIVIGNGFDLAHGLPTKYGDFFKFCNSKCKGNEESKWDTVRVDTDSPFMKEFYSLIKGNLWIEYFNRFQKQGDENWIDFEREISDVIQSIDNDMQGGMNACKLEDQIECLSNGFLNERYGGSQKTYQELRDNLLDDLNNLTRALEIYLCEFVEQMGCLKVSPDIMDIITYPFEYVDKSTQDKISKVISFNYTSTYGCIYFEHIRKRVANVSEKEMRDHIDHIHGKADIGHNVGNNNMILGIDEYLPGERKNKDVEFIAFKKYYQRICKGTGCKYKEWVHEIKRTYECNAEAESNCMKMAQIAFEQKNYNEAAEWSKKAHENCEEKLKKYNLYIFGHSLDITDGDILRELILNDNVQTIIFYKDQKQKGQQIANLVKVIGQDEVIGRTGGSTRTIEFRLQRNMIDAVN